MKNCVRKIGILISENFNLILKSFCVFGRGGGHSPMQYCKYYSNLFIISDYLKYIFRTLCKLKIK